MLVRCPCGTFKFVDGRTWKSAKLQNSTNFSEKQKPANLSACQSSFLQTFQLCRHHIQPNLSPKARMNLAEKLSKNITVTVCEKQHANSADSMGSAQMPKTIIQYAPITFVQSNYQPARSDSAARKQRPWCDEAAKWRKDGGERNIMR